MSQHVDPLRTDRTVNGGNAMIIIIIFTRSVGVAVVRWKDDGAVV